MTLPARKLLRRVVLLICAFCVAAPVRGQTASPDMIFLGGPILTMADGPNAVEALALKDGMVFATGSEAQVLSLGGATTRYFDLEGRTLMPGFVDAHTHLFNDAWRIELDLAQAQALAFENGITTLSNLFTTEDFLGQMRDLEVTGVLKARVSAYLSRTDNCGNDAGDWYKQYPPTRVPGERLRIGGIKIYNDGGSCGRPALSVPRPDGDYGNLFHEEDALQALIAEAEAAGYQAAIHARGDRAIEVALNAIGAALDGRANTLRHRIDHNDIVRPDLLSRYEEIGIVPVLRGWYYTCLELDDQGWVRSLGEGRTHWISPARALLDANPGVTFAWHGDDPWVGPVSPLKEMEALVTRIERRDSGRVCEPPEWLAQTALEVDEVLAMMTTGAAYALDRDTEVGSLETGKYADMILLSANPRSTAKEFLHEVQVLMTMVGGEVVFGTLPTELTNVSVDSAPEMPRDVVGVAFPNPSRDLVTFPVEMTRPGRAHFTISDMTGRIVRRITVVLEESRRRHVPLSLTGVPAGVYLVEIQTPGQRSSRLITVLQ